MNHHVITGLKLIASVPLGLVVGGAAARILENGLWPLLFLPDRWLTVLDMVTMVICQLVGIGASIWFWALGR